MIAVDHFKEYNDQYGHPAGDVVLKRVARLLQQEVRATDVVARYGGEEFAIIRPDVSQAGAHQMAERLRTAIRAYPWELAKLTISLGVSTIRPRSAADGLTLLTDADRALYASRQNGRDRVTHVSDVSNSDRSA